VKVECTEAQRCDGAADNNNTTCQEPLMPFEDRLLYILEFEDVSL
jgi:hypothetical protein